MLGVFRVLLLLLSLFILLLSLLLLLLLLLLFLLLLLLLLLYFKFYGLVVLQIKLVNDSIQLLNRKIDATAELSYFSSSFK